MPTTSLHTRSQAIKQKAADLGLDLCGVSRAFPVPDAERYGEWITRGMTGDMDYLVRRRKTRMDPTRIFPGLASVVSVALSYNPSPEDWPLLGCHPIACYAWGRDYHRVLGEKVEALCEFMEKTFGCKTRPGVDTIPFLERSYAAQAGLGWIGKNTMLLNRNLGSFLFLGEVLTDLELSPDEPAESQCRDCTLCMEACPTGALIEEGVMDARRCISYLTLEHRSPMPEEFKGKLHGYLAGCDLCQCVCPYNSDAPPSRTLDFQPVEGMRELKLEDMRSWPEDRFTALGVNSSLERAKPYMWRRSLENNNR